jgi:integrase
MATFKICVFKHQKRKDGKYAVSIRVTWKKESSYMKTEYYVSENQISQKKGSFELKDTFIINELNRRIEAFERAKLDLGISIHDYSAKKLSQYFSESIIKKDTDIDFLKFGYRYCEQRKAEGKSYHRIVSSLNSLNDFCNGNLPIQELTSKKLIEFEKYLKTERKVTRNNQFGNPVTVKKQPVSILCIADYMSDIRTVFNAALLEYNDDEMDNMVIKHYPFRKYKLPKVPETPKRNITAQQIREIADFNSDLSRINIAKDVFMLSFFLVGINLADLYCLTPDNYKNGRITYNRQKTRERRKDNALISIKVEPETIPIIEKYKDITGKRLFNFHIRYSTSQNFVNNINKGLKKISEILKIDCALSSYYARHSWATIARNQCKISKSDIAECLNHSANTITDIYIAKDWSVIDEANRKVIDYIFTNNLFCEKK